MVIYFQSISDIITNSSSEIFTIYNESTIEDVKTLVNSILKAGGSHYEFDDLFEAKLAIDKDIAEEDYECSEDKELMPLEEFIINHDKHCVESGEGCLYTRGIKVIPKDLDNTKSYFAAGYLSELGNIFKNVVLFC